MSASSEPLTRVVVALDWTPNGNHLGFYVAKAEGFYARAPRRAERVAARARAVPSASACSVPSAHHVVGSGGMRRNRETASSDASLRGVCPRYLRTSRMASGSVRVASCPSRAVRGGSCDGGLAAAAERGVSWDDEQSEGEEFATVAFTSHRPSFRHRNGRGCFGRPGNVSSRRNRLVFSGGHIFAKKRTSTRRRLSRALWNPLP